MSRALLFLVAIFVFGLSFYLVASDFISYRSDLLEAHQEEYKMSLEVIDYKEFRYCMRVCQNVGATANEKTGECLYAGTYPHPDLPEICVGVEEWCYYNECSKYQFYKENERHFTDPLPLTPS